mgnify:CR=1 FL=1
MTTKTNIEKLLEELKEVKKSRGMILHKLHTKNKYLFSNYVYVKNTEVLGKIEISLETLLHHPLIKIEKFEALDDSNEELILYLFVQDMKNTINTGFILIKLEDNKSFIFRKNGFIKINKYIERKNIHKGFYLYLL